MGSLIIIIIIGLVIYGFLSNLKSEASRVADNATAIFTGQYGRCLDCKYCRRDTTGEFSRTGYFCALSRCEDITESTKMDCMVKPVVTEDDLKELFSLGLWTPAGEQYIRSQLLGKVMCFSEVDQFLKRIPYEHPEFLISNSGNSAQERMSEQAPEVPTGGWRCQCGRTHYPYVTSCSCGKNKWDVIK